MFGLSTKERIYKIIIECSKNHLSFYEAGILDLIENLPKGQVKVDKEDLEILKQAYMRRVWNSAYNHIKTQKPAVECKISEAMENPKKLGLTKADLEDNMTPGIMLIILLFAIKNKKPNASDCANLDIVQQDLLKRTLISIDEQLKKEGK